MPDDLPLSWICRRFCDRGTRWGHNQGLPPVTLPACEPVLPARSMPAPISGHQARNPSSGATPGVSQGVTPGVEGEIVARNLPGGDQTGDQLRDEHHAQFRHGQPDPSAISRSQLRKDPAMSEAPTPQMRTADRAATVAAPAPLLVTVMQACQMLGLGRTSIHHLVRNGQLKPVRIGSSVRFSVDHLREFVVARSADR